jgi:GntR family transcriptional regulator
MTNGERHPRQATELNAFSLSKGNGRPLFVQLHEQIIDRISAGELTAGARRPPVRRLAEHLVINYMTVAKADKGLVKAGFAEGCAGGWTYVRAPYGTKRARGAQPAVAGPLLSERLRELAHAPGVIAFVTNYPEPDPNA